MFTGIIEAVGRVRAISRSRLEAGIPAAWSPAIGESVAVNGVCLTAVSVSPGRAAFDLSAETFGRTALGELKKNCPVNLERAIKADGRFSGHFVTGHVDGTVSLLGVERAPGCFVMSFRFSPPAPLVEKGSVALDGVSLTVYGVGACMFKTAVIPHTLKNTTLGWAKPGGRLNVEYDLLGKYAQKGSGPGITMRFLSENGFIGRPAD